MAVFTVISEIRQSLVHPRVMFCTQVPGLSVFRDMLAEVLTACAARCRTIALRQRRHRRTQQNRPNQNCKDQYAFHDILLS